MATHPAPHEGGHVLIAVHQERHNRGQDSDKADRGDRAFVRDLLRDIERVTVCGLGIVAATWWPYAGVVALGVGAAGAIARGASRYRAHRVNSDRGDPREHPTR
ncbi:hypothetical protein BU204_05235 [Actinophytocola xanthii]|uniref:Uncharacterized protein n=1 Tax=Actinophytocola xanthii TaxID=1912961 RepID=A0A1Q8CWE5_9PSEU|nr:hypothetical protein BU204_05235 [Actinophytocola xanthii]